MDMCFTTYFPVLFRARRYLQYVTILVLKLMKHFVIDRCQVMQNAIEDAMRSHMDPDLAKFDKQIRIRTSRNLLRSCHAVSDANKIDMGSVAFSFELIACHSTLAKSNDATHIWIFCTRPPKII